MINLKKDKNISNLYVDGGGSFLMIYLKYINEMIQVVNEYIINVLVTIDHTSIM